jgi:hypothetical protein
MTQERIYLVANDFEAICLGVEQTLRNYVGAFIEGVTLIAAGTYDRLEIRLVQVPQKNEVLLSLERIYYLQMAKPPELGGSFIDDVAVHHLPNDETGWPRVADGLVHRFPGLPQLVYIGLVGPTSVKAVASVVAVSRTLISSDDG